MAEQTLPALKPCPFCCSQNVDVSFPTEREPHKALCFVVCRTCHAIGPVKATTEKARSAWNLRTPRVPYV